MSLTLSRVFFSSAASLAAIGVAAAVILVLGCSLSRPLDASFSSQARLRRILFILFNDSAPFRSVSLYRWLSCTCARLSVACLLLLLCWCAHIGALLLVLLILDCRVSYIAIHTVPSLYSYKTTRVFVRVIASLVRTVVYLSYWISLSLSVSLLTSTRVCCVTCLCVFLEQVHLFIVLAPLSTNRSTAPPSSALRPTPLRVRG